MEYKGLQISNEEKVLDKVTLTNSELKLLASGDGTEIMIQKLNPNIIFDIYPDDKDSSLMDFFYVLEGSVVYLPVDNKNKVIISEGEYFYTRFIKEPCVFKTLSKVKMLYVSSRPIFHNVGESLIELHKINQEINKKDRYTLKHSERVQELAVKIGLAMNLNRDILTKLSIAALFHDLGKIYIDDNILNKPSKLTEVEYELIKMHPIHSAKYVKNIKYMDVSEIVLQHHERIDGSGYPYGLKDNDICLEAKIIAVADSYDAMTTDRPYRKSIGFKKAMKEIVENAGKLYSSDIVNAFVQVMK